MSVYFDQGPYLVQVLEQNLEKTKLAVGKTQKDMIVFKVSPKYRLYNAGTPKETNEQLPELANYRIIRLVLDPTNEVMMRLTMAKLRIAGFKGNSLSQLNLVNSLVRGVCRYSMFNNNQVEQWDFFLPPPKPKEVDQATMAPLASLDSQMGKFLGTSTDELIPPPEVIESQILEFPDQEVPF